MIGRRELLLQELQFVRATGSDSQSWKSPHLVATIPLSLPRSLVLRRGHESLTRAFCLATTRCINYELGKKGARHAFCLANQSVIRACNKTQFHRRPRKLGPILDRRILGSLSLKGQVRRKMPRYHVRAADSLCNAMASRLSSKRRLSVQTFLRFCRLRRFRPVQRLSSVVHGAEMRVAETKAVNRALRKEYGVRRGTAARHRTDLS
jgi:hypothetical protein